ncbi:Uncharacterised protein [Raoultella planticola]|nr:Uncharacterised protein [Raoultella planticola]
MKYHFHNNFGLAVLNQRPRLKAFLPLKVRITPVGLVYIGWESLFRLSLLDLYR